MTNEERYQKYIEQHCKNCKNNKTDLCDIRISAIDNIVMTKCWYYDKGIKKEQK